MTWRFNRKILVSFILALLLVAGIGALSIRSTSRLEESARWVSHTRQVIEKLGSVLSDLKDMESAGRGYVIVTDAQYLTPYWEGLKNLDADLDSLRGLLADNPQQQKILEQLESLITDRLLVLQEIVDAHRTQGFEASAGLVRSNRGIALMNQIRAQVEKMELKERALLEERERSEDKVAAGTKIVLATGSATAFVLLVGSFWLLQRESGQRVRAEQANQSYLERIRNLYDTAPCGYHSLDKGGVFLEINQTECKWLGYTREEIIGHLSFSDVLSLESRAVFLTHFPVFMADGILRELEMTILHRDGTPRTVLISATANYDEHGEYLSSRSTMFDITERKAAERHIAELNAATERNAVQLQAANNELEAFSYTVSHDLRAPLRHLDGFVQLLQKRNGDALDERGKRYLKVISDAARQMGQLIDDLLVFAKMGRTGLAVADVDFNKMLREVVEAHTPEYVGREIEWKIDQLPTVQGDSAMLRVVWMNLVSNAIKYTRPRAVARIKIGWELRGSDLCFFIRDNGVGFDMEHAGKLFGVFQRLHRTEDFEGTGIGLASVRRIVHRHGGKTTAEGAVGQGTVVYFMLPKHELRNE